MKTEMARVVVIGTSCIGKTTFAQSLARMLNFPYVELDALHWQPNWVPRAPEEFCALTAKAHAQDSGSPMATTGLFVISCGREPQL